MPINHLGGASWSRKRRNKKNGLREQVTAQHDTIPHSQPVRAPLHHAGTAPRGFTDLTDLESKILPTQLNGKILFLSLVTVPVLWGFFVCFY